uniref:Uncharacterized protein n=1 Tax=Leersia perrieri TaxID=77586 RepID=A0A0D9VVC9_9ORYZ
MEAAFDQVMEWLGDEVMDGLLAPETVADDLEKIRTELEHATANTRAARAALAEAAALLREDTDASEILFAGAFAVVVPDDDGPDDPEATLAAAAKLVSGAFSDAPLLPGAIATAMELVAGVYALFADYCSTQCRQDMAAWEEWTSTMARANVLLFKAEMRLQFAICEVQEAVLAHRLYRHPRLLRLMPPETIGSTREASSKLEQIVSTAILELDAALDVIRDLCETVAAEERVVLKLIDRRRRAGRV